MLRLEKVKEELADVFNYAFMIADKYHLDVKRYLPQKDCKCNAEKYPVERQKAVQRNTTNYKKEMV